MELSQELKAYGFFYLKGELSREHVKNFLYVSKLLHREDLTFQPIWEVCYERMLSKNTSLLIEGFDHYSQTGRSVGYFYDFYKATYIKNPYPRKVKIYGLQLTERELLCQLKGFSFLLKTGEGGFK